MRVKHFILIGLLSVFFRISDCQQLREWFVDSTDNALDVSNFLATRTGFLPIPTFITEPAVGYGFGMGLVFFHRSKEERQTGVFLPLPKGISVVGGMFTQNGTWAAFLAHQGSWKEDKIRYIGFAGWVDVNMTYYSYREIIDKELSVDFNVNGFPFYQELMFRVAKTNLFLGGQYVYFSNNVGLKSESPIFPEGINSKINSGGLGGQLVWDNRDNIFTTNKGTRSELNFMHYAPYFGGDNYYNMFSGKNIAYMPIGNKVTFGLKLEAKFSYGDLPFYAKPFVKLRGVPFLRYQDDMAFVIDTDIRYNLFRRWSLIGFIGTGAAVPYNDWQNNLNLKWSAGGGFRYFLAKMYNMHAGIDVALGPENWAWYIVVGSYWGR